MQQQQGIRLIVCGEIQPLQQGGKGVFIYGFADFQRLVQAVDIILNGFVLGDTVDRIVGVCLEQVKNRYRPDSR